MSPIVRSSSLVTLPGDRRHPAWSLRRQVSAAFVVAIAFLGIDANVSEAHHAWNEIDTATTMTLGGTVKSLKWENPHASLVLDTVDGGRSAEWTVMMSGIARMEGRGVHRDAIAVGKPLTIVCSPARDESQVVRANRIRGDDGVEHVLY